MRYYIYISLIAVLSVLCFNNAMGQGVSVVGNNNVNGKTLIKSDFLLSKLSNTDSGIVYIGADSIARILPLSYVKGGGGSGSVDSVTISNDSLFYWTAGTDIYVGMVSGTAIDTTGLSDRIAYNLTRIDGLSDTALLHADSLGAHTAWLSSIESEIAAIPTANDFQSVLDNGNTSNKDFIIDRTSYTGTTRIGDGISSFNPPNPSRVSLYVSSKTKGEGATSGVGYGIQSVAEYIDSVGFLSSTTLQGITGIAVASSSTSSGGLEEHDFTFGSAGANMMGIVGGATTRDSAYSTSAVGVVGQVTALQNSHIRFGANFLSVGTKRVTGSTTDSIAGLYIQQRGSVLGGGTLGSNYGIWFDSMIGGNTNYGIWFDNNPSNGSIATENGADFSIKTGTGAATKIHGTLYGYDTAHLTGEVYTPNLPTGTQNNIVYIDTNGRHYKGAAPAIVYNVVDYGAISDSVTDNTAAFQAAIDAIPEKGGTLWVPSGIYNVAGNLVVDKSITILGGGGNFSVELDTSHYPDPARVVYNYQGAIILHNTDADTFLTLNATGCTIEGVTIMNDNPTRPTSGCGVFFTNAGMCHMGNTVIKGFYDNLIQQQGVGYTYTNSFFVNPVHYNFKLKNPVTPDQGDASILGCTFWTDNDSATDIRFESSGGLKIANCKFQPILGNLTRFYAGIDVFALAPGTSVLLIQNNSIEGFNGYAIRIRKDVGASFNNVVINGNQILPFSLLTNSPIEMTAINNVAIVGNVISDNSGNTGPAITLTSCTNVVAYPNTYWNWTQRVYNNGGGQNVYINPLTFWDTAQVATGAIPYGATNGQMEQKVSQLKFDAVNNRLGVGTSAPNDRLQVLGNVIIGTGGTPSMGMLRGDNLNKGTGGAIQLSTSPSVAADQYVDLGHAVSPGTFTSTMRITSGRRIGVHLTAPTAFLHLGAGLSVANGAAFKFTAGSLLPTPESGAWEYDGNNLNFTISAVRKRFALCNDATPASGDLPVGNGTDFTVINSTTAMRDVSTTAITTTATVTAAKPTTARSVTAAGSFTITLTPTTAGQIIHLYRSDATGNVVTVQSSSGNINGGTVSLAQGMSTFIWDGANWLFGQ